jgi:DNA polymerase elongation subunit (family B)
LPSILEELLKARKTTRKLIPLETDDFMKNVLDKRQLAYKLTANSLYGQCGAKTSTFYERDVASATTATGRMLLTYAKRVIEETYGNKICNTSKHGPVLTKAEYIYGDSVANYTPVYVKVNGQFNICTIEDLANLYGNGNGNWVKCCEEGKQEKEYCELNQLVETWTEKGWTRLHRVIRHVLAPHKKMMRILTHTGLVDVTDDHSLLLSNGKEISPKDVSIGTELLHNDLPKSDIFYEIKNDKLYFNTMLDAAKCCYNYKQNNILFEIDFNPLRENCYYVTQIKERAYLSLINDNVDICDYTYTNVTELQNNNKIKAIHEIPYDGYVYDLTTDNHHFAAGVGNMIVHNTDSVFFTFNLHTVDGNKIKGKEALEITIELAQEAGHLASSFLKAPHDLEYEKTFMPFCLLSKKRYVGMLYEHDAEKGKRKEMGIVLKRRDNAPIVKDIYGGIIDILMKQQDIQKAVDFLKGCLKDIVDEKCSVDKLIITKSLRSGYKNNPAHKILADRITARDPGNKPGSGDRIPYIFIHTDNKKALQCDRIETPTYIRENKLKIDYSHYITNQIMKPVAQVFALVIEKIWTTQKKQSKITRFRQAIQTLKDKTSPEKFEEKLDDLRAKEVKALLFDEFLRETNNQKDKNQPLTKYFNTKK